MNANALEYISVPNFILFFIVLWISVSMLISVIGGWRSLSGDYRANFPYDGKKLRMKSVSMRWGTSYSNCVTIGANKEGLYLSVLPIFRIGHPTLFIPWADISTEEGKQLFFFKVFKFKFVKHPNVPVVISKRLAEKIFKMREESLRGISL